MNDLIEALQILQKYGNDEHPTNCEHDILMVYIENITDSKDVSKEDLSRLEELGFDWDEEYECFTSYKFGSC